MQSLVPQNCSKSIEGQVRDVSVVDFKEVSQAQMQVSLAVPAKISMQKSVDLHGLALR